MISTLIGIGVAIAIGVASSGTTHGMEITSRQSPRYQGDRDKY
jgi:hypothetical protein